MKMDKNDRQDGRFFLGKTCAYNDTTISKATFTHVDLQCIGHSEGVCIMQHNTSIDIHVQTLLTIEEAEFFEKILHQQIIAAKKDLKAEESPFKNVVSFLKSKT